MQLIQNHKDLKITNLEQLPRGIGASYLEVIESHIPGTYIAKQWRRSTKGLRNTDCILICL
jgi:putative lipoic acid-binding regulatory protein